MFILTKMGIYMRLSKISKIKFNLKESLDFESGTLIKELDLDSLDEDQIDAIEYLTRLLLIYFQNRKEI